MTARVIPTAHDTGMVTMCSQRHSEFDPHARAILGLPVDVSLRVPQSDLRLFGKPESFTRRRMGSLAEAFRQYRSTILRHNS